MLHKTAITAEEENLRQQVRHLNASERARFYTLFQREVKDPDTYAVLNYLFISGLHHFYLEKWWRGLINLIIFVTAVFLMFNDQLWLGIYLFLTITIIELYALFRSQIIVQDYNNRLMRRLLNEITHHPAKK